MCNTPLHPLQGKPLSRGNVGRVVFYVCFHSCLRYSSLFLKKIFAEAALFDKSLLIGFEKLTHKVYLFIAEGEHEIGERFVGDGGHLLTIA